MGSGNSGYSDRGDFSRLMPTDEYLVNSQRPASRYQQHNTLDGSYYKDRSKGHGYGDYRTASSFSHDQQKSQQTEQISGGTTRDNSFFSEVAPSSERGDASSKRQPAGRLGSRKAQVPDAGNQERIMESLSLLEQTSGGDYSSGMRAPGGVRAGMRRWGQGSGEGRGGELRKEDHRVGVNKAFGPDGGWGDEEGDGVYGIAYGSRERRARRHKNRRGVMRSGI